MEDASYNTCSGLRGHSYKLCKPNFRLDTRKFTFIVRVINIWNALTYSVLQCNTQYFQAPLGLVFEKRDICKLSFNGFFPPTKVKLIYYYCYCYPFLKLSFVPFGKVIVRGLSYTGYVTGAVARWSKFANECSWHRRPMMNSFSSSVYAANTVQQVQTVIVTSLWCVLSSHPAHIEDISPTYMLRVRYGCAVRRRCSYSGNFGSVVGPQFR